MTDNEKMREEFGKWLVQRRLGRFADFDGHLIDCTAVFWEVWQAAKSVPVVGDVLFYASDSTPTAEGQIQYDVCAYQKDYSFFPVYRKPTDSITTAELERLKHCRELLKAARDDVEETLHFMRTAYRDSPRNKTRLDKQCEFLKQIDAAIAAEGEKE